MTIKPGICVGCRICELACSLSQKNLFNPQESNILVHITETGEVELEIVQECSCVGGRAYCAELCPVDALQADPGD
ncbi:4Fe-4S ferredoxin [Dethiosulfatarculus sandiegensis]|uniref:4Fe-4S ferredoxin n=1 Tax=Dethiosulfatarculus sandiegensis TaxID=1429043 RepID=A0A0D2J3M0_9BACT|nr:4Fe-4S ferredoxin [Dethiosulfatarculus sandiegensis]